MKRFERQGASGTTRLLALILAEAILLVGCSNNDDIEITEGHVDITVRHTTGPARQDDTSVELTAGFKFGPKKKDGEKTKGKVTQEDLKDLRVVIGDLDDQFPWMSAHSIVLNNGEASIRATGRTDSYTVDYALESMVPAAQGKGFDVRVTHIYPPVEVTDPTKEQ